jgi:pyruvate kinase
VAGAILDGTDAVMLSAETAMGRFPSQAVEAMDRIAVETERGGGIQKNARFADLELSDDVPTEVAIAAATTEAARRIRSPLIVVYTRSGFSARVVSSLRPNVPILAITDSQKTYRSLAMVWGVDPVLCDNMDQGL